MVTIGLVEKRLSSNDATNSDTGPSPLIDSINKYAQAVSWLEQAAEPHNIELLQSYKQSHLLACQLQNAWNQSDELRAEKVRILKVKDKKLRSLQVEENTRQLVSVLDQVHSLKGKLSAEKDFRKTLRTRH
jgi:hypothetical protein